MSPFLGETVNKYILFLPFPLHLTYVAAEGSRQMIYSISSLRSCHQNNYSIELLEFFFSL